MLTTILLDLDETLCDTTGANNKALDKLTQKFLAFFPTQSELQAQHFANAYLKGIYRELDQRYQSLLLPIIDEKQFRLKLIKLILNDMDIYHFNNNQVDQLQTCFDDARMQFFDFFPQIETWIKELRKHFTLGVITNGPVFSQQAKVNRVQLRDKVDFVIIGGEEPEQKPAKSIFDKALKLAKCSPESAIHIGDSLSADIQGANNAGIQSIWISHDQVLPENTTAKPTYTVNYPIELSELINKISSIKEVCKTSN